MIPVRYHGKHIQLQFNKLGFTGAVSRADNTDAGAERFQFRVGQSLLPEKICDTQDESVPSIRANARME